MKFVFVSSSFNIGGVATSFATLVDNAIDKKDEIELHVVDQTSNNKAYIPERVKVTYIQSNYKDILGKGAKNGVIFLYQNFGFWSAIKRIYVRLLRIFRINNPRILSKECYELAQSTRCDVTFILQENDPCLFHALYNIETKKRIAFFHTAGYLKDEYKPIYCSRAIDDIITVSKGNRDFLVENMPQASHKIHIIHNIVPVDKIKSLAKSVQELYRKEELPILFAGRICQEKGIGNIIEAVALLKNEIPAIHWYLLGRFDGRLTPESFDKSLIEKEIKERVTVLPAIWNPYPYIAQSWAIINPSYFESYGMVIREAQILGKPVIATRTYGGVELIEDGKTGVLVNIDNSHQIADAIRKLYTDNVFYEKIVATLKESNFDESELIKAQFNALMKS